MTSIADSSVKMQTTSESNPSPPGWFGESNPTRGRAKITVKIYHKLFTVILALPQTGLWITVLAYVEKVFSRCPALRCRYSSQGRHSDRTEHCFDLH